MIRTIRFQDTIQDKDSNSIINHLKCFFDIVGIYTVLTGGTKVIRKIAIEKLSELYNNISDVSVNAENIEKLLQREKKFYNSYGELRTYTEIPYTDTDKKLLNIYSIYSKNIRFLDENNQPGAYEDIYKMYWDNMDLRIINKYFDFLTYKYDFFVVYTDNEWYLKNNENKKNWIFINKENNNTFYELLNYILKYMYNNQIINKEDYNGLKEFANIFIDNKIYELYQQTVYFAPFIYLEDDRQVLLKQMDTLYSNVITKLKNNDNKILKRVYKKITTDIYCYYELSKLSYNRKNETNYICDKTDIINYISNDKNDKLLNKELLAKLKDEYNNSYSYYHDLKKTEGIFNAEPYFYFGKYTVEFGRRNNNYNIANYQNYNETANQYLSGLILSPDRYDIWYEIGNCARQEKVDYKADDMYKTAIYILNNKKEKANLNLKEKIYYCLCYKNRIVLTDNIKLKRDYMLKIEDIYIKLKKSDKNIFLKYVKMKAIYEYLESYGIYFEEKDDSYSKA